MFDVRAYRLWPARVWSDGCTTSIRCCWPFANAYRNGTVVVSDSNRLDVDRPLRDNSGGVHYLLHAARQILHGRLTDEFAPGNLDVYELCTAMWWVLVGGGVAEVFVARNERDEGVDLLSGNAGSTCSSGLSRRAVCSDAKASSCRSARAAPNAAGRDMGSCLTSSASLLTGPQ